MDHILLPAGLAVFFAGAGAFFALGFAGVCRLMEWSPVNVTVNINNPPGIVSSLSKDTPDEERP